MPTVFDNQVTACKTFFQKDLPFHEIEPMSNEDKPVNLREETVFNITGYDAHQVVATLSRIVNARDTFKPNQTFCLLIQGKDKDHEVFELKANPTNNQPGNGTLLLRPAQYGKSYGVLYDELKTFETKKLAEHIEQFFKNTDNVLISAENFPRATIEVYMLWLFEIARRLVKSEKPSKQQMNYDNLPIGSAIARLVRLLKIGDAGTCRFEDVFLRNEKLHCFTGEPEERKKAVHNINDAVKEELNEASVVHFLEELQEMFCSAKRLEKLTEEQQLAEEEVLQKFKSLGFEDDYSSSEAEEYT